MIYHPSCNFSDRPDGAIIDTIVLHYTALPDVKTALHWLCDPTKEVSAHYFICKTGRTYQLVQDHKKAWHAGKSAWKNATNLNFNSIGIELDHDGNPKNPYHAIQITKLLQLLELLCETHSIPKENVIGHSDIAPLRKNDPGSFFPWDKLYEKGFGLPPKPLPPLRHIREVQIFLKEIGYSLEITDILDDITKACINAYKDHLKHFY
jgi:N-acetylmuramoyl-L-alanine amidase